MSTRGFRHTPEARAKISAAGCGRKQSKETRAKISAANSGSGNGVWKGNAVGYMALHERVRKHLPHECAYCGATERLEVALSKDAKGEILTDVMRVAGKDRTVRYSVLVVDYMRLCVPCHRSYDLRKTA